VRALINQTNIFLFFVVWIALIAIFPTDSRKSIDINEILKTSFYICKSEAQNAMQLSLCVDSNRRAIAYYEVNEK